MTPPQRTSLEQIRQAAARAAAQGAAAMGIVNSGRGPAPADLAHLAKALNAIRPTCRAAGCDLCASLGELTDADAARLARSGVVRYNHNLETSRRFYPTVVTTHAYEDRLRTLAAARAAGMELCCGGLFGLGETWNDRADLALTLRDEVAPHVVPLNFLHPIPGTPLASRTPMSPMEILTVVAVFRLVLPDVDIKIAGGRLTNLRDLQSWVFYAGATSCITGDYLTTCGRPMEQDMRMASDLGLRVVKKLSTRRAAGRPNRSLHPGNGPRAAGDSRLDQGNPGLPSVAGRSRPS